MFRTMKVQSRFADFLASALFIPAAPFLILSARKRAAMRWSRRLQDIAGVSVLRTHYYEPVFANSDPAQPLSEPRALPGIEWNLEKQIDTLNRFGFSQQLRLLEGRVVNGKTFSFGNSMFGLGDAEALYSFVRAFRPSTLIEIGSGQSTLVVRMAAEDARKDDSNYRLQHVCFEPFENGWLESTEAEIRRVPIECADLDLFRSLKANDIVFIDSSHVVRTQGDVECEYLRILPCLPAGVIVHIHDIFSPRDYPDEWIRHDRRFWTEQYMLEAFLSCNDKFEILLALNDLHKRQFPEVYAAFPMLAESRSANPGSFWIRRKHPD